MYIDGVIVFSLLMIALILVMMGYVAVYFYRHIKQDAEAAKSIHKNAINQSFNEQPEAKVAV